MVQYGIEDNTYCFLMPLNCLLLFCRYSFFSIDGLFSTKNISNLYEAIMVSRFSLDNICLPRPLVMVVLCDCMVWVFQFSFSAVTRLFHYQKKANRETWSTTKVATAMDPKKHCTIGVSYLVFFLQWHRYQFIPYTIIWGSDSCQSVSNLMIIYYERWPPHQTW